MAETLGSLCDKLTVIKLKQYHSEDQERQKSLSLQEHQLQQEIDEYIQAAINGSIPVEQLMFTANKVYKKEGNLVPKVEGNTGKIIAQLADVNCRLWHVQELVYEFENVPAEKKNQTIKNLALLNLERTTCIDQIDKQFRMIIEQRMRHKEP